METSGFSWDKFLDIGSVVLFIGYQLYIIFTVFVIVRENRRPVTTISWMLVLILIPFVGLFLYFLFGRNVRKEKLFDRKKIQDLEKINAFDTDKPRGRTVEDVQLNGKVAAKKNIINLLQNNGPETYEALLSEIEKAKAFIHLEFYIFEEGKIAEKLKELLVRKCSEGVEVRMIYDAVGSWKLGRKYLNELRTNGVEVQSFMPVLFPYFTSKLNYRNHRKMVIVDGKIGFVGGINISDKYIYDAELKFWRDSHLCVCGEAVHSMQMVFAIDWFFLTSQFLGEKKYFFRCETKKTQWMQIISSGPDSDSAFIMDAYFAAIATAKESVYISTPYFLPTESILQALKSVSLAGVDVRMILPGVSDINVVQYSARSYIEELLKADIKVYLYQEGFIHAKLLTVDGVITSVGTANMDYRSFEHNLEVNAVIYDEEVAVAVMHCFEKDILASEEIKLEEWKKRSYGEKTLESFARLLSPLF